MARLPHAGLSSASDSSTGERGDRGARASGAKVPGPRSGFPGLSCCTFSRHQRNNKKGACGADLHRRAYTIGISSRVPPKHRMPWRSSPTPLVPEPASFHPQGTIL